MSRSQNTVLDALENAVHEAVAEGKLDDSVLDNAPVPNVFYPGEGEPWDEDDIAAIRAVGERDVQARIDYYARALDSIKEDRK